MNIFKYIKRAIVWGMALFCFTLSFQSPSYAANLTGRTTEFAKMPVSVFSLTDGIDRSKWIETPINNQRNIKGEQCKDENNKEINCWIKDDKLRDKLQMNTYWLNFVTQLNEWSTQLPADGRYIYVYKKSDNSIYVRNYDRDDSKFVYEDNCRQNPESPSNFFCPTQMNKKYLHVRHTQLNGGWDPVWCAGEMRIEKGKICFLNNASGHFAPQLKCVQDYVKPSLKTWGIKIFDNLPIKNFDDKYQNAGSPCL